MALTETPPHRGTNESNLLQLHISTGDNYVLDSQSSTQDEVQTSKSREKSSASAKPASQSSSANKSTAKSTATQSTLVLHGLKELKDFQQQTLTSMNQMISAMKSTMESFAHSETSRKRKRDEMSLNRNLAVAKIPLVVKRWEIRSDLFHAPPPGLHSITKGS